MPVQFAHASSSQPHVDTGNRFRNLQLAHRDLARPSTFLHAFVRNSERILECLHAARVGLRRQERVRILRINRGIARAGRAGALIALDRVRGLRFLLRVLARGIRRRKHAGRQRRRSYAQKSTPRKQVLPGVVDLHVVAVRDVDLHVVIVRIEALRIEAHRSSLGSFLRN